MLCNWRLKKIPYLPNSARSGHSNAVRCELDNQHIKSVLALKIFESIHKMHLCCFGVNMHPCYQVKFFFVCSRCSSFSKRHKFAHSLHFMTSIHCVWDLTWRKQPEMCLFEPSLLSSIYPKVWDKPLHTVAVTAGIFGLFCGYRLTYFTNMFYSDSTMTTHYHWTSRKR